VKTEIAVCSTRLAASNLINSAPLAKLLLEVLMQLTDIDENANKIFQKVVLSFPADIIARYFFFYFSSMINFVLYLKLASLQ